MNQKIKLTASPDGSLKVEVVNGCGSECESLIENCGVDTSQGEKLPEYHDNTLDNEQETE